MPKPKKHWDEMTAEEKVEAGNKGAIRGAIVSTLFQARNKLFQSEAEIEMVYKMFHAKLDAALPEVLAAHRKTWGCQHEFGQTTHRMRENMWGLFYNHFERECKLCTLVESADDAGRNPTLPDWAIEL